MTKVTARWMFGSIFAGCSSAKLAMWAFTNALRIIAIAGMLLQLKRE